MNKIITNDEIKILLGMSGDSEDAVVQLWNKSATQTLLNLLQIAELVTHNVIDERVEVVDHSQLCLSDFPVDIDETITIKNLLKQEVAGLSFLLDPKNKRTVNIVDSNGVAQEITHCEVFASYTAGYSVQGTVEVLTNNDLAEKTIKVYESGTPTTYTFKASGATGNEINVGGDTDATAANIAAALGGSAAASVATLPLGTIVELVLATTLQLTIIDPTIPEPLKMAVALIAGGGIAERQKKGGVNSYTIGSKTVSFRTDNEAEQVKQIVNKYAAFYRKVYIGDV